jgi:glycosyltransferase involved in cell wall biosynthesis
MPTITSILAGDRADFILIVVDQSDDEATAEAIAHFLDGGAHADQRVIYVQMASRGLSRARNRAIAEAARRGCPIVAFTDDDCTVASDWLSTLARVFQERERVGVAFNSVVAAPYDSRLGFIPDYQAHSDHCTCSVDEKGWTHGMGAGMAVRVATAEALGGFDERLGVGGPFCSAEDHDLALRALMAGWHIYETDRTHVVHYGFRPNAECRELIRRSWTGLGATLAKMFRTGHIAFAFAAFAELFLLALRGPLRELARGRRPRGLIGLVAFARGGALGLSAPLDRRTASFLVEGAETARAAGEVRSLEVKDNVRSIA